MPQPGGRRFIVSGSVKELVASIRVDVGPDETVQGGEPIPLTATIDTGSTATAIRMELAAHLGLRFLRDDEVKFGNQAEVCPIYAAHVIVGGDEEGMLFQQDVEVVAVVPDDEDMLYGMDMLAGGTFTMHLDDHGNGTWKWTTEQAAEPCARGDDPPTDPT